MVLHRSWLLAFRLGLSGLLVDLACSAGGPISQPASPNMTICWQCSSYANGVPNPQCPADDFVDVAHVYRAPCFGKCFTRTARDTQPTVVYRGCTESQWGLPDPLPPDGCYTWAARSEVWCLCTSNGCNGARMGEAGEVTFESYKETVQQTSGNAGQRNDTVLPPSFVPGASGVLQCWQCVSDLNGQHYSQCPLHQAVDATRAYIGNCTGRCFMYNDTDRTGLEVMKRGCTDTQWNLPDPLPADGCYWWFHQVWCICSADGCNGVALGTPTTDVEFDGFTGSTSETSPSTSRNLVVFLLLLLSSWVLCEG